MSTVMMTEPRATQSLPKIFKICAPVPAAPMVWAMVLRVRIAASGRSMFSFISLSLRPDFLPALASTSTCEAGSERMPASSREQKNETPSASDR